MNLDKWLFEKILIFLWEKNAWRSASGFLKKKSNIVSFNIKEIQVKKSILRSEKRWEEAHFTSEQLSLVSRVPNLITPLLTKY